MGRKYIDDLGIEFEDTPQGRIPNDERQKEWEEDRDVYGFDERETWSLDYTLNLWLYERLCFFNEFVPGDKAYYKFEYKDKILTLQDCINKMVEGLKIALTTQDYAWTEEQKRKVDEIYEILSICIKCLCW